MACPFSLGKTFEKKLELPGYWGFLLNNYGKRINIKTHTAFSSFNKP